MGGAFYRGLSKGFSQDDLYVADLNQSKLDELGAKNSSTNPDEILNDVDIVILAVKPQSFEGLMSSMKINLNYKLVVSIMAGIEMKQLKELTGSNRIVRAMPNLSVKIGKGITGWMASDEVGGSDIEIIKKMFSALGSEMRLENESMISALTVISGCGPAYYFLLTELLEDKAKFLGFSDDQARKLAEKTFFSSMEMLKKGDKSSRDWRHAVSSKGGVTEAILESLENNNFHQIFSDGIDVGLKRDEELNG